VVERDRQDTSAVPAGANPVELQNILDKKKESETTNVEFFFPTSFTSFPTTELSKPETREQE
jgi:alkyl hydroperoxide reductase subunit AhpC